MSSPELHGAYVLECELWCYVMCKRIMQFPVDTTVLDATTSIMEEFGLDGWEYPWEWDLSGRPNDVDEGVISYDGCFDTFFITAASAASPFDPGKVPLYEIFEKTDSVAFVYHTGQGLAFWFKCIRYFPDKDNPNTITPKTRRKTSRVFKRCGLEPYEDLSAEMLLFESMPNIGAAENGIFGYWNELDKIYAINSVREDLYKLWEDYFSEDARKSVSEEAALEKLDEFRTNFKQAVEDADKEYDKVYDNFEKTPDSLVRITQDVIDYDAVLAEFAEYIADKPEEMWDWFYEVADNTGFCSDIIKVLDGEIYARRPPEPEENLELQQ